MNNDLRVNEKNQVVLCCGDKLCPVLEKLLDGRYKLTDDYGSSVIITAEQAKIMGKGIDRCDEVSSPLKEQLICG